MAAALFAEISILAENVTVPLSGGGSRASRASLPMLAGALLLAFAAAAPVLLRPSLPGKLIADEAVMTWRSPAEGTFRKLSLDAAQAKFRLKNTGGTAVRILDVQSSCGCATPEIHPKVVAPGQVADVDVKATPIQIGKRSVDITLTTDSSASRTIVLKLNIIGSRRAPFLFDAKGDLNYPEGTPEGEARQFLADQMEDAKSRPTPPLIENDLKFIEIDGPEIVIEKPASMPGSVHRRYSYKVRNLIADGDVGRSGQFRVVDPWDPEHVELIQVHCEPTPAIKVSPPRALLTARPGINGEIPVAKFAVATREAVNDLVVELEDEPATPLVLSMQKADGERCRVFSITLKQADVVDGLFHVLVGRSSAPNRIRIPVAVRNEVTQ